MELTQEQKIIFCALAIAKNVADSKERFTQDILLAQEILKEGKE